MPLDGHSYLVTQGWSGKGSGLREGAITRPLAIPQKKTLSGLGKDRDDAFPFWDHLYSIATKSIKIKIHKDEDDSSDTDSSTTPALPALSRTSTGILSNRRPVAGTPVSSSGTATPSAVDASSSSSSSNEYRISIMATAKRVAARRSLYSRFFRGPVLGPDYGVAEEDNGPSKTKDPEEGFASEDRITLTNQVPVDGFSAGFEEHDDNELRRKRRKEERKRKAERTERKKRKGKEKQRTGGVQDDANGSIQKRNGVETGEDVAVKVSKKKNKRKEKVGEEPRGSVFADVLEDDDHRRSKKKRKKDTMVDVSVEKGGDADQQSKAKKETSEERRRRKEEKRRRKEQKRRREASDLSS